MLLRFARRVRSQGVSEDFSPVFKPAAGPTRALFGGACRCAGLRYEEYISDMGLRSRLTGLLAVIFLAVSCSASTCALSCEMSALHPSACTVSQHPAMDRAAEESMPDHCGHIAAGPEKKEHREAGQVDRFGPQCDDKLCSHDEAAALTTSTFQLQPTFFVLATISPVAGLKTVARLPNAAYSDVLPHTPPRPSAVLRL
jgi:hypothetical protein